MPYSLARKVPGVVLPYNIGVSAPPRLHSVAVPKSQVPGHTAVYRSILNPNSLVSCDPVSKCQTVYHIFERTVLLSPLALCFGRRPVLSSLPANSPHDAIVSSSSSSSSSGSSAIPKNQSNMFFANFFEWITYSEAGTIRDEIGSGLSFLLGDKNPHGFKSSFSRGNLTTNKINVGIYSANRPEWVVADLACASFGFASVALYDTLGAGAIEFIINEAEVPIVFASVDRVVNLLNVANKGLNKCPTLQYIICMDNLNDDVEFASFGSDKDGCGFATNCSPCGKTSIAARSLRAWAKSKGIYLFSFAQLRAFGKTHAYPHKPPTPNDINTICYTSGTTGDPKGALLMHKNFAAQNVFTYMGHGFMKEDVYLSYLPLAHIFERSAVVQCLSGGCRIGFFSGIIERVVEDVQLLRPTYFISVPRLLNRIYAGVRAATIDAPGLRGVLFRRAYAERVAAIKSGNVYQITQLQRFLFSRVANVLGGRLRVIISGSAPLSGSVLTFLRAFLMCEVLEGFGQTENAAGATLQLPGEYNTENVGVPLVCCELRLADVEDMGYTCKDVPRPRGELLLRGNNVFAGYLKREKETASTLTADGWLRTGDIGAINVDGTISIIDRKKNIFKLAQGEYCAPEKIENAFCTCTLVAQIFVHGDSLQSCLVAIIVPNMDTWLPWARKVIGTKGTTLPESALASNKDVVQAFLKELDSISKANKLQGFEYVKAIYIETIPFSIENDLLTPSMKLRRNLAVEKYRPQIDKLYSDLQKPNPDAKRVAHQHSSAKPLKLTSRL